MADQKKKKILIVEDEEILSEMYQDSFAREGFEVVTAATGQEAVDVAKAEKPDFVLLDMILPSEDGIYFLKEKRKDPEIRSIPVVAFSAYDHPDTKKETLELGVQDYLLKTSYTPHQIINKVKKYVLQ